MVAKFHFNLQAARMSWPNTCWKNEDLFTSMAPVPQMECSSIASGVGEIRETKYSLRGVVCSSLNAETSSFLAPTKFVPYSHLSSRTFPLRLMKSLRAFRNESLVMLLRVSKCIAREERQVNIRPHRLSSFRPSLI